MITLTYSDETLDITIRARTFELGMNRLQAAVNGVQAVGSVLTITNAGTKKIQAIKAVRTLTYMGLKEAKELVEAVENRGPQHVQVPADYNMLAARTLLQEAGCTVEMTT